MKFNMAIALACIWAVALLTFSPGTVGCAAVKNVHAPAGVDLRGSDLSLSLTSDPVVTWVRYRVFLQAVLDGGVCDGWQLDKAVGFFEDVTNIPSALPGTALGIVLDRKRLGQAVSKWDKWFRNGNAIHLERISQAVMQLGSPVEPK